MIHIVTDSCSDITQEEAAAHGITVVPLTIRFGNDEMKDGVDLDADSFYGRLVSSTTNPSTSQPSPPEFTAVYERLLADPNDSVVSIHISSKLSGTVQSATLAAEPLGDRVRVIDSHVVTAPEALAVFAAQEAAAADGATVDSVAAVAEACCARSTLFGLVDTMEYLVRGGRAGRAQGLLAGVLNIKPLVTVTDGEVAPAGRFRGHRAGIDGMFAKLEAEGPFEAVRVMHSSSPDLAAGFAERIRASHRDLTVEIGQIGPVVGTYTGPGVVGVGFVRRS